MTKPHATPLHAAVIGCGVAGSAHAFAYENSSLTKLVAVVDVDAERGDTLARKHGVRQYDAVDDLLEDQPLDVVSVATWPDTHRDLVVRIVATGRVRGILCEKPIAMSLSDARDMVSACARADVRLAVNSQRIFGQPYRLAAEALAAGEVGEILELHACAATGGLLDWGWHWVETLSMLSGDLPVEWVSAQIEGAGERLVGGVPTERWSMTTWQLRHGARVTVECGVDIRGRPVHRVIGSDGMLEVGARPPGLVTAANPWGYGPTLRVMNAGSHGAWRTIYVAESCLDAAHWTRSVDELADSVGTRRRPLHDGERAVRTLEIILAAYASARRGTRVSLPFDEAGTCEHV